MKLVVLGASGRTGRWVSRIAAERGHRVRAVVRDGSEGKVETADEVVTGDVLDAAVISRAFDGQDAVVSTLGLNRAGLNPWSRLLSPPDLVTRVMTSIAAVCSSPGSPRVVWMSAGGAGMSLDSVTGPVSMLIRAGNVGVAYRDLDEAERVMAASAGAIAARPVTLLNGATERPAAPVPRYSLLSMVRRCAVARWMVGAADGSIPVEDGPILLGTG